ncbi:MAG: ATP-dependent DNA helicase RecG [Bacteroidales bacterium]|nr:ATP-dependent DNA helicase RecG [Bacteroidales bacterium]
MTNDEIKFIKGVGPKKAELLQSELGIFSIEDILSHYPYKYIDRSKIYSIREIKANASHVQIKGRISGFKREGQKYRQRLIARFADHSGEIELVWFQGVNFILKSIKPGIEYIVFGKPSVFNRKLSIAHPEMETCLDFNSDNASKGLLPQYNTTEKMKAGYLHSKAVYKIIQYILKGLNPNIPEFIPNSVIEKYRLISRINAIHKIHLPQTNDDIVKAEFRLKFEELFLIQLNILKVKIKHDHNISGFNFAIVGKNLNQFYQEQLPFELTNAQKRVIREIRTNMGTGRHMNRLLQGDVGSGKTLVALMCMLIAIDNGYQACLMAPTEILASQHFKTLTKMLGEMPVTIRLLTGSTTKKNRAEIHELLQSGNLNILVGTHALLEKQVQFANLGLAVIDEQHRFGVAQRAKLWKKNDTPPHVLVMTATPIPRTLAMTVYGDLDVSVIDELPPGRKPIQTLHYMEPRRLAMYGFMKREIEKGRQVYVVFPLIQESEKLDYKALEEGYDDLKRHFPYPEFNIVMVHGRMTSEEKDTAMRIFKENKAQIMVATTVIEVGVDVPNATLMIIESSERFGLSQLHQLRGRVGRGGEQSHCILMSSYKLSNDGRKRLETMVRTNNGFEIAEVDMQLRGPGDIEGTQQSGLPFDLKIANIARDGQVLQLARDAALEIMADDPELVKAPHQPLRQKLNSLSQQFTDWSKIS